MITGVNIRPLYYNEVSGALTISYDVGTSLDGPFTSYKVPLDKPITWDIIRIEKQETAPGFFEWTPNYDLPLGNYDSEFFARHALAPTFSVVSSLDNPYNIFKYTLNPQIKNIIPLVSGGNFFIMGLSSLSWGPGDITRIATNKYYKYPLDPDVGLLSSTTPLYGNITGFINYKTGELTAIFSDLAGYWFPSPLGTPVWTRYAAYYDAGIRVQYPPSIAQKLLFNPHNDTYNYVISARVTDNTLVLDNNSLYFFPYHINIENKGYRYEYNYLSATYQQGDSSININTELPVINAPTVMANSGRPIQWLIDPTIGISAWVPKNFGIGQLVRFDPVSGYIGWSTSADYIAVSSNPGVNSTPQTYSVSVRFLDVNRYPATYTFDYNPILSEGMVIDDISVLGLSTTEWLQAKYKFETKNGIIYDTPFNPIVWNLSSNISPTTNTAYSGIYKGDLNNTKYLNTVNIPFTGSNNGTLMVPTYDGYGNIVAYDYIYGGDQLKFVFEDNKDLTTAIYVLGSMLHRSNSAVHYFTIYTPPTAISIQFLSQDNLPFVRSITAKAYNNVNGTLKELHERNNLIWSYDASAIGSIWIKDLVGSTVNIDGIPVENRTLVYHVSTSTFDNITTFPYLCSFNIMVSAIDNLTNQFVLATSRSFSADTFPSSSLLYVDFKLNYDFLENNDIWRINTAGYTLTVNVSNITAPPINLPYYVNFGDGTIVVNNLASTHAYPATAGIYTVQATVTGDWLDRHIYVSTPKYVHFISNWLNKKFIAYPSYVFQNATTQLALNDTNYTSSSGVCAYDMGHTEVFHLSATEANADNYVWRVGNLTAPNQRGSTIAYNLSTGGTPICLSLYNDTFPASMPNHFITDTNVVSTYPNINICTDNSNKLFQNIRMTSYEKEPQVVITASTSEVDMYNYPDITASYALTYTGIITPVIVQEGSFKWVLSASKWSSPIYTNDEDFSYKLTLGDGITPGTIKNGTATLLKLSKPLFRTIPSTFEPHDWPTVYDLDEANVFFSVSAIAYPKIYTTATTVLTGQTIEFENISQRAPGTSYFIFDDGNGNITNYSPFNNFYATYDLPGTYTITITTVFTNGATLVNIFEDLITVISDYTPFDKDVRLFGFTPLQLPNSLKQVLIPANEWATNNNFNHSLDLLLKNLHYMEDITDFYMPPPQEFYGWLGTTQTTEGSSFNWNVNIEDLNTNLYVPNSALNNSVLSGIDNIFVKDDIIYLTNSTSFTLLSGNYNGKILNTRTYPAFGQDFIEIKSIQVDQDGLVYILDKTKNKVYVLESYSPTQINKNELLLKFGAYGGYDSTGFRNPNDMFIDIEDTIWIADTGNNAIKRFSKTGSLMSKFTSDLFTKDTNLISLTLDSQNNIHVLTNDKVYKFTKDGTFIKTYTLGVEGTPQKIRPSIISGFLYISLTDKIIKVTEDGAFGGSFALNFVNPNFSGIFHDEFGYLYVTNQYSLLKFYDTIKLETSYRTTDLFWDDNEIYINKDEYIQDWVCNKSFARMWDNIDIFKRSLYGKLQFNEIQPGVAQYTQRDFTPAEYNDMFYVDKADVFVGVNELVSNDVINRCLTQLYNYQLKVLGHL
jgi:hypothetical protein